MGLYYRHHKNISYKAGRTLNVVVETLWEQWHDLDQDENMWKDSKYGSLKNNVGSSENYIDFAQRVIRFNDRIYTEEYLAEVLRGYIENVHEFDYFKFILKRTSASGEYRYYCNKEAKDVRDFLDKLGVYTNWLDRGIMWYKLSMTAYEKGTDDCLGKDETGDFSFGINNEVRSVQDMQVAEERKLFYELKKDLERKYLARSTDEENEHTYQEIFYFYLPSYITDGDTSGQYIE